MTGQDRNEEARAGDERPTPITDRVKDREQTYGAWHPIGVARARADGRGVTVAPDPQPRVGRATLRPLGGKADRRTGAVL